MCHSERSEESQPNPVRTRFFVVSLLRMTCESGVSGWTLVSGVCGREAMAVRAVNLERAAKGFNA